jgi:ribosomal protein L34E
MRRRKNLICDKCGNPIEGVVVVVDFRCYHPDCTDKRPSRGRAVESFKIIRRIKA